MAYTSYPAEAKEFASKANLINDELVKAQTDLKSIQSNFKVDKNEDYLTVKTLQMNSKILKIIKSGSSQLSTETSMVKAKAAALEREAAENMAANEENSTIVEAGSAEPKKKMTK